MAITNYDRVGKAMELLKDGLIPFVERELKSQYAQQWIEEARTSVSDTQAKLFVTKDKPQWDIASILSVVWNKWELVFRKTLGRAERSIVSELREVRNKWAHQNPFSGDDTDRALDPLNACFPPSPLHRPMRSGKSRWSCGEQSMTSRCGLKNEKAPARQSKALRQQALSPGGRL